MSLEILSRDSEWRKNVLKSPTVYAFQSFQCCLSHPQTFFLQLEGIKSSTFFSMEKINRYISNTEKGSPLIQCSFCVCVHFCVGSSTANIIILPTFLENADREWWRHFSFFSPLFFFHPLCGRQPTRFNLVSLEHIKKAFTRIGIFFLVSSYSQLLFNPALRKRHASFSSLRSA